MANEVRTLFIGTDGEQTVDSETTQTQINRVVALECALEYNSQKITWKDLNDPEQPMTIFQAILKDRELRVGRHVLMAYRPAFAVITAIDKKAVRCEIYSGHDSLYLMYDLRSRELQGTRLPNYLESDPQGYDPAVFLKEALGIPENVSKPVLDAVHSVPKDSRSERK